ncbi:SDR family NAD(P)-dependent oxidoreductase [Streptomyces sp. NBC_01485]|uniref:SDR family NAD(P)-dependent oxidoreductase n=1 Tax=Streptomyces sp. NBC_01485 TaxID=2903884 RepID=UPI002E34EB09|nr:SDR family NAD(P)-dependent oxidoreductase [Streptomyces sp. NBC_01485]
MESTRPQIPPIAVVGVGALTPGAADAPGFWRTVLSGRDVITDVPESHWSLKDYYDPDPDAPDRTYGRRGSFLDPVNFDPTAFGIPPSAMPATDTAQLLALAVAQQVLEDAGANSSQPLDRERVSVIIGAAALELLHTMSNRMQRPVWLRALRSGEIPEAQAQALCDRIAAQYVPWQEATFPGLLSNVVAGRIANRFDLHGTNYTTDAACAGSLAAVSGAINELCMGTADLVLTGGVDTLNDIVMYMCFSKTPALSKTGDCRPFSEAADGTMLGEALVMFALKRLADAERDGDRVYAVIRGIGTSSDGRGQAIYAPVPEGQARALRRAYETAGYGPDTVELVEAHGTGTPAGDAAEFAALRTVFDESGRSDRQWCALGSVKSQVGHTKSAAGAVGLLKAVFALQHKILPPTIKVDRPNPALDLTGSALYLNTRARPWIRGDHHARRASVSSFGFGGTNFHLTLEEYVPTPGASSTQAGLIRTAPTELVLLGAETPQALAEAARRLAADDQPFAEKAKNSQLCFSPADPVRACLVAGDDADLGEQLRRLAELARTAPDTPARLPSGLCFDPRPAAPGRTALLFTGQGSQYVGMGADLAMHLPQARAAWDRAATIDVGDRPLHRVVFPEPAFDEEQRAAQQALLTRTEWAQPALAVQSLAQLGVLRTLGIRPDCLAGHSFGELVALHAASALDERALIRLARCRGELMDEAAATSGAMLAVGGPAARDAAQLVEGYEGRVWVANRNSPRQVVLSGEAGALAELEANLAARGVAVRRLQASGAFHTPLLEGARDPFARFLDELDVAAPVVEVYGNADGAVYPADAEAVRKRLADHLLSPVLFADEVEAMYEAGVRTFVEVGAGSALGRMVGDILGERPHTAVSVDHKDRHGVTALQQALGRLAVAGVPMDLEALWRPYAQPTADRPRPAPRMSFPLSGANHGAPDPEAAVAAIPMPDRERPSRQELARQPEEGRVPVHTAATVSAGAVAAAESAAPHPPMPGDTAAASATAAPAGTWLHAFEEAQRQAADAHTEFQRLTADAHHAYLQSAERALSSLMGTAAPGLLADPPTVRPLPAGSPSAASAVLAAVPSPPPAPALAPDPEDVPATRPPDDVPATADAATVLYEVIAERTGYPPDMLEPHMELEADLGIDSIKRVEILSLLRRRIPDAPDVPTEELARLRTLGQITERFRTSVTTTPATTPTTPTTDTAEAGRRGPAAPVRTPLLSRSVTEPVPAPAPGLELPGLRTHSFAVVDDGSGVAGPLVEELGRLGVGATVTASPRTPAGSAPYGLILLGGLRPVGSVGEAVEVNRRAFRVVRDAASALAAPGVLVVVQDTGGDFGLRGAAGDRAWLGGLGALARTASKEWPDTVVKAVDCERGTRDARELAGALARELTYGGSGADVGLRADGSRWVLRETPREAEAPQAPPPAPQGDTGPSVIVATGGARGVTAAAMVALAQGRQSAFVLLGRTELTEEPEELRTAPDERELKRRLAARPPRPGGARPGPAAIGAEAMRVLSVREIRATVAAVEAAGSTVRYVPVDIRDVSAVSGALERVRAELGPVTGLVHAAGVLADARLADKTDDEFDTVFGTKVEGLHALLTATADDPLDLVCVFSSVAGRFGNAGQSDYAMANETIAQVASTVATRRPGCVVRSLAWGPWDGGMVGSGLREHFLASGVELIPLEAGAAAFVRELDAGPGPVRVTLVAGNRPDVLGSARSEALGTVRIAADTHPFLADHSVAGDAPLLPMALALEWFATAVRGQAPDGGPVVLRDVEVVYGVRLPDFHGTGHEVTVHATRGAAAPTALRLTLESYASTRYRAVVDTAFGTWAGSGPDGGPTPVGETGPARTDGTRDWSLPAGGHPRAHVYGDGVLFHGPAFHSLEEVSAVGADGAEARVRGVRALGWASARGWHTDPAAVDAGLQLALLWAEEALGAAFLPMGVSEVRVHAHGPLDRTARCVLLARETDPLRPVCDLALLDGDGAPLVELFGVSLVRRPDQAATERIVVLTAEDRG